jgi:hypothetical protein
MGLMPKRLENLDEIPSPYLSGQMEKYFDGKNVPFLESARGCPYACTFCEAGEKWYSQIYSLSVERIKEEILYITQRMKDYPDVALAFSDSNFGMLKRDEELAEYIGELQEKYGWPNAFDVSPRKSQHERIISVAKRMNKKMVVALAVQSFNRSIVQSFNQETLHHIKRKNLGGDRFERVYSELKAMGIKTYSDLILPMPMETKETFIDGLKTVIRANVDRVIPFTTMMLKGTEIASQESREKYGMVTRFRVLPRQFGEYPFGKVFEIEEACVGTSTMPFKDYLDCRGFSFVIKVFSDTVFEILVRHLDELTIDHFEFFETLWLQIQEGESDVSRLYHEMLQATQDELFETPEDVIEFYSRDTNYALLMKGLIGENVFRLYSTMIQVRYCQSAINLAYGNLIEMMAAADRSEEEISSIRAAHWWVLKSRDMGPVFLMQKEKLKGQAITLTHDVVSWYYGGEKLLIEYQREVRVKLSFERL